MIAGVGTDLVELDRIGKAGVERLARRILTDRELAALPAAPLRRLEFVAGRFAAKEAVAKALKTGIGGLCSFSDVEIVSDGRGAPRAELSEEVVSRLFGGEPPFIHLSISHSEQYALAFAVVEIGRWPEQG
jgi:holo-[acyl-carrier protein] synthase